MGGHRRLPQGGRRSARGDLDDHAQLDRDLGAAPGCSATADRCRTLRTPTAPLSNDVAEVGRLPVFWGDRRSFRAPLRLLRRARRARGLLGDAEPHDARLRGAGGRLQSGRGRLRRHQRQEEPHPRHGDLGRFRRARRRARHARVPVPLQPVRHPRLRRSASSVSRSPCSAGTPRSAPWISGSSVRRTSCSGRRTDCSRSRARHRPAARRKPHLHHPGPDRALRRRRRADPVGLELAQSRLGGRRAERSEEVAA